MKKLLLVSSFLVAQQSFACVSAGSAYICNGDLVYKGANYSQGAKVIGENPYAGQVTVRSVSSGSLYTENVQELDVAQGCFGDFCVNDRVYKGANYSQGASIVAINYIKQTLTLKSVSSGSLYVEFPQELESTKGCLENTCVGSLLYKGSNYSQGATVVAINFYKRTLAVRSVSSGSMYSEAQADMYVTEGCLGNVCVNDRVFKGSNYSQGATVVAINTANFMATVRSVSSGSLYAESIYDLQGGGGRPQPIPQPNPWPQPVPQPQPPRPRPDPRPPVPSFSECTVNRLDPSGLFITSYVGSANSMGEACRIATNDCARDIKGRQTCNIVR